MATVSHYAMRRYPVGPVDDTNQLATGQYYVASGSQLSPMYDKSKKTWSQRLKISKVDKPPHINEIPPDYSQSALSRSMKYAEPWLYGTVRGIPARPVRGQAIFAPLPTELAVVVCSCPEYLNGTKKEVKKASICKKCKGSRLPLAPIGGTVRIRSTTAPVMHKARGSAGTVRLPTSSIKSRPTILDPLNDPYDLMRRSRLLSPEPKFTKPSDKTLRNRAKSTSPTRGRSRTRVKSPIQLDDSLSNLNARSRSASRTKQECWLDTLEPDPGGRRSILRCDVNPYDLISNSQYNNEFAPNQDDLFDTLRIAETINRGTKSSPTTTRGNYLNVKEIAGQRISLGESSNTQSLMRSKEESFAYDEIDPLTNQSDDYKQKQILKQSLKQIDIEKSNKAKDATMKKDTSLKPKRPPRRKHETSSADEDNSNSETVQKSKSSAASTNENTTSNKSSLLRVSSDLTICQKNGIKSILKRPSSLASTVSSSSDNDTKQSPDARSENSTLRSNIDKAQSASNKVAETKGNEKTGSQFYLPMPQTRKKVQFMVADEIIHDDEENRLEKNDNVIDKITIEHTKSNESNVNADIENTNQKQELILDMLQQQQQQLKTQTPEIPSQNLEATNGSVTMVLGTNINLDEIRPAPTSDGLVLRVTNSSEHNDSVVREENPSSEGTTPDGVPDELPLQPDHLRRAFSLRRTNSERCANTTTVVLNFNDTMALRVKNNRLDSRTVFFEDEKQPISIDKTLGLSSPTVDGLPSSFSKAPTIATTITEPPSTSSLLKSSESENLQKTTKGLPRKQDQVLVSNVPFSSDYLDKNEVQVRNDNNLQMGGLGMIQDQRDKQQQEPQKQNLEENHHHQHHRLQEEPPPCQVNKKISWQDNGVVMIKNEPFNSSLCNDNKDKENTLSSVTDERVYEVFNFKSDKNSNPISDDKQKSLSFDEQQKREKLLQAQKEIYHGTRIFGNQNKYSQKTVVRVAPFNKTSSEIHRLKIKHEDSNDNDCIGHKRTSILINGDDCYSTVNVSNNTPIYQSSVVVTDGTKALPIDNLKISSNTVTINVSNSRTPEEEIIYKNNKINSLLNLNAMTSVIPINSTSNGNQNHTTNDSDNNTSSLKRGRTLITLDYGDDSKNHQSINNDKVLSHEEELVKILRNPVEAVKRNLIPHVCGKTEDNTNDSDNNCTNNSNCNISSNSRTNNSKIINMANDNDIDDDNDDDDEGNDNVSLRAESDTETVVSVKSSSDRNSFIGKLLEDPTLSQLADGLEGEVVAKLVENSLKRLKQNRTNIDTSGTKDNDGMAKLIDISLNKIKEERIKIEKDLKKRNDNTIINGVSDDTENQSNRGSISSANSYGSANYELFDFDNNESDCYQSCSSEMTTEEDNISTRSKFYQMLVDATLSEIEISTNTDDDHHYESIRLNGDPIYEEISEVPPPLPLSPPPLNDPEFDKKNCRSMFEGASKYDILSYLVDAKERGIVREESYEYNFSNTSDIIVEEEIDTVGDLNKKQISDISSRISHLSTASDSSEDTSLPNSLNIDNSKLLQQRKPTSDIERNDSGVGSETSKTSRSKYQNPSSGSVLNKNSPIHLCEDCDGPVETQITDSGVMYAPLVCRKCGKKRAERKEIITEIVETEEKYGRDLQIILEEFCQPMLVAGLLTQEQLSAIFLNTEELLENNQTLAERMRDALDIAMEQGDDDLLTVNVGKLFLEATPMLHAFESYCIRQAAASLLLANLEKEKELLRIFLRVSQMENSVLRRMNLNSFLMVPVQRVTKYPLLLARLYKVTPPHLDGRELLKQAQEKIELHLNHMNQEAKDVPTKLWRRISSSSPNRRSSCEIDMINIKLRKMAIDVLEWNHDEVRFAMEGKLLFTQPTDSNWKKGRTIKLTPINALLVTNGKPSANYKVEKALSEQLNFPKHTGIREASLLLVKEKCGRYTLIREPLYLDRCVVCTEADWEDYFEVQEISSKDTFIFKAEDGVRTKQWYAQLQYHAQGMGAWRKRRNALANIMINGMLSRT